jgi:hypothetical protein
MRNQRSKQFAFSLLAVLSLLVSSASACCCAHQQEKTETEVSSCHQQTNETKAENHHGETSSEVNQTDVLKTVCDCFRQSAPKVYAKSENVKIEKQTAAHAPFVSFQINSITQIVSVESTDYTKPFYLSDSFYNIKSPRAPPRL